MSSVFSGDETAPFFGFLVAVLEEERFAIGVSTLYYTVAARDLHPSTSLASWMYFTGYVVPREAFGLATGTLGCRGPT
jgi:hypothetical protein